MSTPRIPMPEDVLAIRSVVDVQLAPDGRQVAFVVAEPFKEDTKNPKSRVWIVPADGGEPRAFTSGPRSDTSPRWSPDGKTLAFLSDRREEGRSEIWLLPADGGEAYALTEARSSVSAIRWSPDGSHLAYLMDDPEPEERKKRREEKDDALEVERNPRFSRLYTVDVASGETRPITGEYQVWEYEWSPDGSHFALVLSDAPYNWSWYRARLARVAREGGAPRTLHESRRQLVRPLWSPDGARIAFLSCTWSDNGVIGGDLLLVPAEGGAAGNLTSGYPGSVTWMQWLPTGRSLLASAHERGEIALFIQELDPSGRRLLHREEATFAERAWARFSAAPDGSPIAVAREDARSPRDVWIARASGEGLDWSRLTDLNPQVRELTLGETETVRWKSGDGLEIQGLLVRPTGWEPGKRYPLVVQVHGGPANLWTHRLNLGTTLWAQLLAARGFAVLLPNPRGSTGWGTEFTEANLGDMGGQDWEDILAGTEFCIERGIADPDRLGIGGWSYGGFMTAWAVSQTGRFRAAVMGAGICNWRSFHGMTDIPSWDELFYQASPFEPGNVYDRFSAVNHARRIRTPTLILHGQEDSCVPMGQAYEFFRALKDHGVETELVVYPREGHGILEKQHQLDVMRRVIAWFETRLAP